MISRRTVLRGMLGGSTFCLGLPILEQMLNSNGTAFAAGGALPLRYGMFFWSNGVPWSVSHMGSTDTISAGISHSLASFPDLYTPTTQGKGWAMTEVLKPLAAHQANINVVTGLNPHTTIPKSPVGLSDGHMRGQCVALTADMIQPMGFSHDPHIWAVNRPSLDQYIAKHPKFYTDKAPTFKSLELGMSTSTLHNFGAWNAMSHNGPNSMNPPIRDPKQLFDYVFGGVRTGTTGAGGAGGATGTAATAQYKSVLDCVAEDARQLRARLGARDKLRLDEHLTHISEITRRLTVATAPSCITPATPMGTFTGEAAIMAKTDIMLDILMAALRCDMSRVFTIYFTTSASLLQMNAAGVIGGSGARQMHDAAHSGLKDIVTQFTKMNLTAYSMLLDKMSKDKDVNGETLLDNSVIFGTSEYGEGYTHSNKEHPIIFAGKAGGKLDTGTHYREVDGNMARAHLTALQALGLPETSYGFNGGETSSALPFLK